MIPAKGWLKECLHLKPNRSKLRAACLGTVMPTHPSKLEVCFLLLNIHYNDNRLFHIRTSLELMPHPRRDRVVRSSVPPLSRFFFCSTWNLRSLVLGSVTIIPSPEDVESSMPPLSRPKPPAIVHGGGTVRHN